MRVLVCGGRDYADHARVHEVLDKLHREAGIDVIIEGGARGADRWAYQWADSSGVDTATFEADWENQGSFAGPMRNKRMLEEGRPDLVIAFPGGRGTADMVRKARKASDLSVLDGCMGCHRKIGLLIVVGNQADRPPAEAKPRERKPKGKSATIPSRPLQSAATIPSRQNPWPPKGSRKIPNRPAEAKP